MLRFLIKKKKEKVLAQHVPKRIKINHASRVFPGLFDKSNDFCSVHYFSPFSDSEQIEGADGTTMVFFFFLPLTFLDVNTIETYKIAPNLNNKKVM